MRFLVKITKGGATLDSDPASCRVHMDGAHAREVDDNAIIAKRAASDVVAPSSDRREQIVLARKVDGGDDVGDACASSD
jgi:hypothetical protein